MANISVINKQIDAYRVDFDKVLSDKNINFEKEAMFAVQLLAANNYLADFATSDPMSFRSAILNVAAFGITLNPASKLAYLVPRNRKICLDISYMGLMHIAQQTGAIQWCQSSIVRANDKFARQGIDKAPLHEFNDFDTAEKRGEIVGVYCVVKTDTGDFLTHTMTIAAVNAIKQRSAGVQSGKSTPWKTDLEQMILKTCVKQASKYWPRRERLDSAINYLNDPQNEGIDFSKNAEPVLTEDQEKERNALIMMCIDAMAKDKKEGLSLKEGRLFGIWQGLGQNKKMLIGAETFNRIKKGENPLQDDLTAEYTEVEA